MYNTHVSRNLGPAQRGTIRDQRRLISSRLPTYNQLPDFTSRWITIKQHKLIESFVEHPGAVRSACRHSQMILCASQHCVQNNFYIAYDAHSSTCSDYYYVLITLLLHNCPHILCVNTHLTYILLRCSNSQNFLKFSKFSRILKIF